MFCDKFSLKIYYLISLKYLQTVSHSLFILMKFIEFYKFSNTFNNFNFKFISCDIIY